MQHVLQQMADAQSTTFVIKDLDHRFMLLDQALADSLGLPMHEIIGRNDLEAGIPEKMVLGDEESGFPGFWYLDDQAIQTGCPQHETTGEMPFKTGSMNSVDTLRTPLRDRAGNIIALLVQSRDVSDLIGLHQNLAENRATVELQDGHLSAMDDVLTKLMGELDLETLFNHIAGAIVAHTRADSAYVWMLNESQDTMQVVAADGTRKSACLGMQRSLGEGIAGKAWEDRTTIFNDSTTSGRYQIPGTTSEEQLCTVPMIVDGGAIGLIMVGCFHRQKTLKPEVALVERIASLAAIAIKNAQLMATTRAELSRTRALSELGCSLSTISEPHADTDVVCRKLFDTIDIASSSFFIINEHGSLQHYVAWRKTAQGVERADLMPDEITHETICAWCCENRQEAFISRAQFDPRESERMHAIRKTRNFGSTSCIPVMAAGKIYGTLVIVRGRQMPDFNESEINIFRTVVNQLSAALERYELHSALQHQANHDSLTRLPNRRHFEEALGCCLEQSPANDEAGAVLFMDLDGFKLVNDTLGHAVGDELLKLVANRFRNCMRQEDLLARMGGDEFAVIIRDTRSAQAVVEVANRFSESIAKPFQIEGSSLQIGTSIGVCRFPEDGTTVDDLLRKADVAMYQAKTNGKGRILCFDQSIATQLYDRVRIEYQLRDALAEKQFRLLYQPKVNCATGRVDGVEALLRWMHPSRGLLKPADFMTVAEEAGLINAIGSWVLDEAVRQASQWTATRLGKLRIAVNIAASQFQLEDFSKQVIDLLAYHDVAADKLELEMTESIVMQDIETVVVRLQTLRTAGIRIAIDDFGTGYSSLRYLQDLPLDVLKIDDSFTRRIQYEEPRQSLVNTIMLLASGLNLETVAEGVETLEQKEKLVALGCHGIQGFYYSAPVLPADLPGAIDSINGMNSDEAIFQAA